MTELGFPFWLRAAHFINLFRMLLLIRSAIQILADHPKLYWNDDSSPGTEWIKFGKKSMPTDRLWTSMDEAETINCFVASPGGHHNLGAGRRWHLLTILLWITNGLVCVGLLMATGLAPFGSHPVGTGHRAVSCRGDPMNSCPSADIPGPWGSPVGAVVARLFGRLRSRQQYAAGDNRESTG